jgi:hypothetical protein
MMHWVSMTNLTIVIFQTRKSPNCFNPIYRDKTKILQIYHNFSKIRHAQHASNQRPPPLLTTKKSPNCCNPIYRDKTKKPYKKPHNFFKIRHAKRSLKEKGIHLKATLVCWWLPFPTPFQSQPLKLTLFLFIKYRLLQQVCQDGV